MRDCPLSAPSIMRRRRNWFAACARPRTRRSTLFGGSRPTFPASASIFRSIRTYTAATARSPISSTWRGWRGTISMSDIVAELQKPDVGAVSCVYHGTSGRGLWARLSALGINTHFLPGVLIALGFGMGRPCFGATIALSRSMLERIGGFRAFADWLHDDYAIGAAVRAAGYEVTIPRFSIEHVCRERTARELILNQIRSARTIKMIDPVGYAGSVVTHPAPLALIAILCGSDYGLPLFLLALGARLLFCVSVERVLSAPRQAYWLVPFRDFLSFAIFVISFFGASVSWRGERYRLTSDGRLVHEIK